MLGGERERERETWWCRKRLTSSRKTVSGGRKQTDRQTETDRLRDTRQIEEKQRQEERHRERRQRERNKFNLMLRERHRDRRQTDRDEETGRGQREKTDTERTEVTLI